MGHVLLEWWLAPTVLYVRPLLLCGNAAAGYGCADAAGMECKYCARCAARVACGELGLVLALSKANALSHLLFLRGLFLDGIRSCQWL